jgi:hypothetical protein
MIEKRVLRTFQHQHDLHSHFARAFVIAKRTVELCLECLYGLSLGHRLAA